MSFLTVGLSPDPDRRVGSYPGQESRAPIERFPGQERPHMGIPPGRPPLVSSAYSFSQVEADADSQLHLVPTRLPRLRENETERPALRLVRALQACMLLGRHSSFGNSQDEGAQAPGRKPSNSPGGTSVETPSPSQEQPGTTGSAGRRNYRPFA